MMRMILKVAFVLVGAHLLFGMSLLVIDSVYGINDENFTFALVLLFYYANISGWWMLKSIGADMNVVLLTIAGLPQWIILSVIIGTFVTLIRSKNPALPPKDNNAALTT